VIDHPPGCVGYLVSAPAPNHSTRRSFSTFPADFEPPWFRQRYKLDIRITPLTREEYAKPLVDIICQHAHKLRDRQAEPKSPTPGQTLQAGTDDPAEDRDHLERHPAAPAQAPTLPDVESVPVLADRADPGVEPRRDGGN
jgi:hypothetical protein